MAAHFTEADFAPPWWLANRHVQTALGSVPPRKTWLRWTARRFVAAARDVILDCGAGVRLLAKVSEPQEPAGRVVLMIHGWEGHADSGYMISLAPLLVEQGYTVVRLNLRDHGDSHSLNKELFHSCRLPEVVGAALAVQAMYPRHELALVGFSLGGNFCLRVGAEAPAAGLRIQQIIAVCPVLNPADTMHALDTGWSAYRNFFIRKWRRSLAKKSAAFPGEYDFGDLQRFTSLRHMTDFLITRFTDYPELDTYLSGYALTGMRLAELQPPSTLLLAADDPVIPVQGLNDMRLSSHANVIRLQRGGHCGFMDTLATHSWLDQFIVRQLNTELVTQSFSR